MCQYGASCFQRTFFILMGVTIGAAMHAAIPLVQDLESLQIRDSWQVTAVED